MGSVETPAYGRRLIASRIDELARTDPERVWVSIPSAHPRDGFRDITWAAGANAINCAAWWIKSELGLGQGLPTIAYMGPQDIRYLIILVAAIKTGYVLFLTSPRNSLEDHIHLFRETQCHTFLHAAATNIDNIVDRHPMRDAVVPELDNWIESSPVEEYPYTAKFEDVEEDPYVILHTSSSTGRPKPIFLPQGTAGQSDGSRLIPPRNGRQTLWTGGIERNCGRLLSPFPLFHYAGVALTLAIPAYLSATVVTIPVDSLPSAILIDEILDHGRIDAAVFPPSILEDMSTSDASLNRLSKLKAAFYGGGIHFYLLMVVFAYHMTGPLAEEAGNIVSKHVRCHNWLGTTETGTVHSHLADADAWQYFNFDTVHNGIEWRPTPERNVFEMVFVRDPKIAQFQHVFKVFPELQEFSPRDLYERHPVKPDHWRHIGRVDDILVFSNGEKLMPRKTEELLAKHPAILSALVCGHGRFHAAAILEPREYPRTERDSEILLDEIWEIVQKSNLIVPTHGVLSKSHLMLSSADKPFLRTPKGTLRRGITLESYAEEIGNLYRNAEAGTTVDSVEFSTKSLSTLTLSLRNAIHHIANINIEPHDDFFNAGVNSLHVLNLLRVIRKGLLESTSAIDPKSINPRLIYMNPNISLLAAAILRLLESNYQEGNDSVDSQEKIFNALVEEYTTKRQFSPDYLPRRSTETLTVLLTGSTGSLGSYLLDSLLANPKVEKIYCLNRSESARARQTSANTARGLSTDWDKVTFICADLAKPFFALDEGVYSEMLHSVNYVVHNQWQVDFNLSLASFTPQLASVRTLSEFAAQSSHRAPIIFVSSVATVHNWDVKTRGSFIPSTSHTDDLALCTPGYGESKLAAHRILEYAAEHWGIRAAILRVGQIAGPVTKGEMGMWPKHEWFPSLIASSKILGLLPDELDAGVSFLPVDLCARIVLELGEHTLSAGNVNESEGNVKYYHVVNPHEVKLKDLIPHVQAYFGGGLGMVSMGRWVEALENSADGEKDAVGDNPALKLLGFFQGLAKEVTAGQERGRLDTEQTESLSAEMRGLKGADGEWMDLWLKQWSF